VIDVEPWERRERQAVRFAPLFLLGIGTVITLLQPSPSGGYLLGTLALVVATAGWVLAFDTLNPSWELEQQKLSAVYYLGLLVLAGALILRAPWYGIFAFAGYFRAFDCLTGIWRFVGVGLNALLLSVAQIGGTQNLQYVGLPSFLVLCLLNISMAGLFSYFAWRTQERDRLRKQSNAELAAALEENAGLHAQLVVQAREAGVLDERQRMSREIHDTLAQGLIGIITQLEAAAQNPAELRRRLDNAETLARESLTEARRSVHAVRPEALENARLPEALTDVVRRWSEINDVAAEFEATGTARPLHADVEVTLLRTAQEALANVAKHAKASRVRLTLSYMEDLVTLDVRDDGVGFTPGNGSGPGFGLTSMRQRVQGLDGRLAIESEPGSGTAISATVPLGA
jgi:signal transduction histidine kinase